MILCIAEVRHGKLVSTIFELLTAARAMGKALGQPVAAAVVGGPKASAAAAALKGFDQVFVVNNTGASEPLAGIIVNNIYVPQSSKRIP